MAVGPALDAERIQPFVLRQCTAFDAAAQHCCRNWNAVFAMLGFFLWLAAIKLEARNADRVLRSKPRFIQPSRTSS
jgi:hypothetical protein